MTRRPFLTVFATLALAAIVVPSTSPAQSPRIAYVHASTVSPGVIRLEVGVDPMGAAGELWFRWTDEWPTYSGPFLTPAQPFPADSGLVVPFSALINQAGANGIGFRALVAAAGETTWSERQYTTFDDGANSPDVGRVLIDSVAPEFIRMKAVCNPRGERVSFNFGWFLPPSPAAHSSPIFTFGPFDHDTVLTWDLENITPSTDYYLSATADAVDHPGVSGRSLAITVATTPVDSNARGLTIPVSVRAVGADGESWIATAVNFGVHTSATDCYDYALGEEPIPPPPPSPVIDVRFVDRHMGAGMCLTDGAYTDLRDFRDTTQIDTFFIRVLNAGWWVPVRFSWTDLSHLYSGPVIIRSLIDSVDMRSQTHYDLVHPAIEMLIVTAAGPRPIAGSPNLLIQRPVPGEGSTALLEGWVTPNGRPTFAWFEWGETPAYGAATAPQPVGTGFSAVSISAEVDGLVPAMEYHYRISAASGGDTLHGPDQTFVSAAATGVNDAGGRPAEFRLLPNYPNPFNPTTEIRFALPERTHVTLRIHDALGREVATLVDEDRSAGEHTVRWDAAGMPAGVYFCTLTAGIFRQVRPMVLLR